MTRNKVADGFKDEMQALYALAAKRDKAKEELRTVANYRANAMEELKAAMEELEYQEGLHDSAERNYADHQDEFNERAIQLTELFVQLYSSLWDSGELGKAIKEIKTLIENEETA